MSMKYCTKCGKELGSNGKCPSCKSKITETLDLIKKAGKRIFSMLLDRIGFGCGTEEETIDVFERNKQIVPDIIKPDDGEQPIRQYKVAKLRSRILQKYAEGKLQITNKRIIFRAAGFSLLGRTCLQYEFAINEVGGIEAKKSFRISFLNIILYILFACPFADVCQEIFELFNNKSVLWASFVGSILSIALTSVFFIFKKRFLIKYMAVSAAMGIMTGISNIASNLFDMALGNFVFGITDALLSIVTFMWVFNLMILSFVPELRLVIRTKSAGEAIQIRKKVWFSFFYEPTEYTDFSEVLPWTDSNQAIKEVNAIIGDLQTMGDFAIEKWKTK